MAKCQDLCGKKTKLEIVLTTRIRNGSKITHLNQVLTESQLLQLTLYHEVWMWSHLLLKLENIHARKIIFEIFYPTFLSWSLGLLNLDNLAINSSQNP